MATLKDKLNIILLSKNAIRKAVEDKFTTATSSIFNGKQFDQYASVIARCVPDAGSALYSNGSSISSYQLGTGYVLYKDSKNMASMSLGTKKLVYSGGSFLVKDDVSTQITPTLIYCWNNNSTGPATEASVFDMSTSENNIAMFSDGSVGVFSLGSLLLVYKSKNGLVNAAVYKQTLIYLSSVGTNMVITLLPTGLKATYNGSYIVISTDSEDTSISGNLLAYYSEGSVNIYDPSTQFTLFYSSAGSSYVQTLGDADVFYKNIGTPTYATLSKNTLLYLGSTGTIITYSLGTTLKAVYDGTNIVINNNTSSSTDSTTDVFDLTYTDLTVTGVTTLTVPSGATNLYILYSKGTINVSNVSLGNILGNTYLLDVNESYSCGQFIKYILDTATDVTLTCSENTTIRYAFA